MKKLLVIAAAVGAALAVMKAKTARSEDDLWHQVTTDPI